MPSLGPAEILVILVVALLVFGPTKMPDMARQAGRAFQELRRVQHHLRKEISGVMGDLDPSDAARPSTAAMPAPSEPMGSSDPVPMLPPKDPAPDEPATPSSPPPADPT